MTDAKTAAIQKWTWDTFRANNPDITLVIENLYNEPFHNKTEVYAASGNLPDVLYVWQQGRSTSLHQKRLLKDLTPLIDRDRLRRFYNPAALDTKQQAFNYQAMIPLTIIATHVFYVNKEVLDACGLRPAKTYAELKAQVPVLAAKGYETVIMPNNDTWVMQSCLFSMIAGRFCGEGWDQKILNRQAKFTDADFVNALAFVKQMYDDKVISRSTLNLSYNEGPVAFATNKSAYYIDGDWRASAFITDSSTGIALISPSRQPNFLITVFPDIEGAKINKSNSVILGSGWAMSASIPAGSPKEEAAWRLIKWLIGKEVLARQIQNGYITTGSRTDIDLNSLKLEPLQKVGANLVNEYQIGTAVIDGVFAYELRDVMNDVLREIGLGSKTPQQAAADIQKAFDRWR